MLACPPAWSPRPSPRATRSRSPGSATRTKPAPKKLQINARKVLPSLWRADIVARFAALNPGNNSMTKFTKIALTIALAAGITAVAQAQISYTGGTYTQDANSFAGTLVTVPTGWSY